MPKVSDALLRRSIAWGDESEDLKDPAAEPASITKNDRESIPWSLASMMRTNVCMYEES